MITQEQWRTIEGYEGLYEVSNMGRVRSLDRIDKLGRLKPGRILSPSIDKKGYCKITLFREGVRYYYGVHRLVAQAFLPNPEGLPIINHKDENPSNNRVDNLEWCTYEYNINYGTRNERAAKNMLQTRIREGIVDPELCGLDRNEHDRRYRQKNREKIQEYRQKNLDHIREYHREYMRNYRRRKKQVV